MNSLIFKAAGAASALSVMIAGGQALAFGALLQTASTPPTPTPTAPMFSQSAVDAELEATRSWLQLSLVDFESARFMAVQVKLNSPDRRNPRNVVLVVCGLVNARNSMGGYTGFQPFWHGAALPGWRQAGMGPGATDVCGPANRLSPTDYSDRMGPRTSAGSVSQ